MLLNSFFEENWCEFEAFWVREWCNIAGSWLDVGDPFCEVSVSNLTPALNLSCNCQIKMSHSKDLTIVFSITGPGADQPPRNLFIIDAETGWLCVTQPLDREKQAKYTVRDHFYLFPLVTCKLSPAVWVRVHTYCVRALSSSDSRSAFSSQDITEGILSLFYSLLNMSQL